MENIKITHKNFYEAILNYANGGDLAFETEDGVVAITPEQLAEFAIKNINSLDAKAVKAKERAAKKKAEGDDLYEAVYAALGDEFEPIANIALRVEGEDVTVGKVINRLGQLARNGKAEKQELTVPGIDGAKSRKVQGYRKCAE